MTEKRSDYRKRQSHKKNRHLLKNIKAAFDDRDQSEQVDVNPDFKREASERTALNDEQEQFNAQQQKEQIRSDKALRLKKRLNSAILIVFVLIILVLLALFKL